MFFSCAPRDWVVRARRLGIAGCVGIVAAVASFDICAALTSSITLYDAGSNALPSASPWNWIYGTSGSGQQLGMSAGATFLDTTAATGDQAGYSKIVGAGLDSLGGFKVDFSLGLVSEFHANSNRAGFSVIVLDSTAHGVELGFWTNEVWAQNADFTHSVSERALLDTTALRTYHLSFTGTSYLLSSDGASFGGSLRNYAPSAPSPFNLFVYSQTNYIFWGDDTGSAAANVLVSKVAIAPIPEPAEWVLIVAGLGWLVVVARGRCQRLDRGI